MLPSVCAYRISMKNQPDAIPKYLNTMPGRCVPKSSNLVARLSVSAQFSLTLSLREALLKKPTLLKSDVFQP